MDKNKVSIIHEISSFKFGLRELKAKNTESHQIIGIDGMSNYRTDAVLIFNSPENEYVELCIYWNLSTDTKIYALHWESFNDKTLMEIAYVFNLGTVTNRDGNRYLNNKSYADYSATLCIKKSDKTDNYFIAIYYYDNGENRRNPELYVHGIWEVKLSEDFKKEIFGVNI